MKSIHLSISKKTILSIKSITMHITTKISKKTVLFLITAILLLSGFASFFVMPRTANASFLSICDWLDVLPQKAQKGLIDTNPSDVGPIAGLQQVISEPDLLAKMEAIGKYQHGRFDKPTEILLGLWQKKHGVVENAQDTEYGKVGEKTMRVLKRYCGGYVSARGTQIVPDGPQISYTLFYPTKDGTSFVSKKVKLPKYTVRIADQALRALFNGVGVDRSVACSPFNANDTFGCGFTITTDSRSPWLGAAYRGVTLSDGQATVVFDKKALPFFETAQISHLVYTSIQKTLTQFSTIQTVRIKIKDLGQHGTGRIVKVIEDSKEVNKKENSIYVNSSLTTNQINAIITLLQSFGADQMTINKVRASLTGQMSYSTSSNTSYSANNNLNTNRSNKFCPNLYRNLYLGTKGQDVRDLQLYLRQEGFYNYPEITGYFGPATMRAVQRFQSARGIISYGSPESTGFGVVGPRTRERMRCGAQLIGTNTYHQQMIASDTIKRVDVSTEYKSYTCPGCSRPEQTPIKVLRVSLSNGQIVTALSKNQYWKFGKVIGISSNRQYVAFTVLPETGSADIHIYVFDARTRMSQKVTYNGNPVWLLKDPSDKDAYWESDVLYLNKDGDLYKSRSIKQPWNLSLLSVATRNCKRTFNDEDQQIYYENQYPQYSGLAIEVSTKTACLHFCDGIETENPGQCIYNGNVIRIWD